MDARRRLNPEEILKLREEQIALSVIMSGQFDAQLKEMRQLKIDIEGRQLVERTLAEAEQIKHAAIQFAEGERATVAGIVEDAEGKRQLILEGLEEARAVLGRADQEKTLTAEGWEELEREKERRQKAYDRAEADLRRRQEMHAEKEAALSAEYDKVRQLQDTLKTRLRKLETVDAV